MNRKLHLHVVTTAADHDPYDPTCIITVPLGSGLGATVQDGSRRLTVADLGDRHTSASLLWQDAATEMLATLGNLTSVHGTALRHRDVDTGIREIAVIGTPFPAAGLLAHPLLAVPTHRILADGPGPALFFVTDNQQLFISSGATPSVPCTGPIDISEGHCQTLESVP
ncbi:Hypothetical protein CGLY_09565 [Corynebacterium glyciniphilum AJ 3170]|uniref:Uncharacterized protein n=1 Tax=Corynebacterium glyciniphilum AJ 3170 TaxID=1404245 RepID=X5DML8_9CORY|nr:hypothetical protein [Corynebacterium glyciniphilum]AHW64358.1 Hypothetical protein CGLY_09565 [Corynebacterium glyciniphilum AJ 3170]